MADWNNSDDDRMDPDDYEFEDAGSEPENLPAVQGETRPARVEPGGRGEGPGGRDAGGRGTKRGPAEEPPGGEEPDDGAEYIDADWREVDDDGPDYVAEGETDSLASRLKGAASKAASAAVPAAKRAGGATARGTKRVGRGAVKAGGAVKSDAAAAGKLYMEHSREMAEKRPAPQPAQSPGTSGSAYDTSDMTGGGAWMGGTEAMHGRGPGGGREMRSRPPEQADPVSAMAQQPIDSPSAEAYIGDVNVQMGEGHGMTFGAGGGRQERGRQRSEAMRGGERRGERRADAGARAQQAADPEPQTQRQGEPRARHDETPVQPATADDGLGFGFTSWMPDGRTEPGGGLAWGGDDQLSFSGWGSTPEHGQRDSPSAAEDFGFATPGGFGGGGGWL